MWWATLVDIFGKEFLVCICIVYFLQGFQSFLTLALNYYLQNTMELEPAVMTATVATTLLPWTIKPIYGMITDSFALPCPTPRGVE